jgi:hypothetical protein
MELIHLRACLDTLVSTSIHMHCSRLGWNLDLHLNPLQYMWIEMNTRVSKLALNHFFYRSCSKTRVAKSEIAILPFFPLKHAG